MLQEIFNTGYLIAREIQSNHSDSIYTYPFPKSKLLNQFPQLKIQELLNCIHSDLKNSNQLPDFSKIIITEAPVFKSNSLYGVTEFQDEEIHVTINSHLNDCWKRFIKCKEICQIYCDYKHTSDSNWFEPGDIIDQISKLITGLKKLGFSDPKHGIKLTDIDEDDFEIDERSLTEFHSLIAAIHLIFPATYKELSRELYSDVIRKNIKMYDIAFYHQMPEYILNTFHKMIYPYHDAVGFPNTEG